MTTRRAPAWRIDEAARSGSASPVMSAASARLARTSRAPGTHAFAVSAAPHGDYYSYCVDKFWRVVAVQPDHKLVILTRRGKRLTVADYDPALRPASWWERLFLRHRFPAATPPE